MYVCIVHTVQYIVLPIVSLTITISFFIIISYIGLLVLGVRGKHTSMKRIGWRPTRWAKGTLQFLTSTYSTNVSYIANSMFISPIPFLSFLQPSPDAEVVPRLSDLQHRFSSLFLDGPSSSARMYHSWLDLGLPNNNTPPRPNPSLAGRGTARGEDYA